MFENIGENLSAMISIPTVSGAGNEPIYHIEEYRNYLRDVYKRQGYDCGRKNGAGNLSVWDLRRADKLYGRALCLCAGSRGQNQ